MMWTLLQAPNGSLPSYITPIDAPDTTAAIYSPGPGGHWSGRSSNWTPQQLSVEGCPLGMVRNEKGHCVPGKGWSKWIQTHQPSPPLPTYVVFGTENTKNLLFTAAASLIVGILIAKVII